jgi:hypothetical protein
MLAKSCGNVNCVLRVMHAMKLPAQPGLVQQNVSEVGEKVQGGDTQNELEPNRRNNHC